MTSVGYRTHDVGPHASSQELHWSVWTRLSTQPAATSSKPLPQEVLLHGPCGVGKTMLLRRLYWDLFDNQDEEIPLLSVIGPESFRPVAWVERFATETVQQWAAYVRRDAELAQSNLLSLPLLIDLCYAERLAPLAEMLEELQGLLATSDGRGAAPVFLVDWVFGALERVADRMDQRLVVLIDGADSALWRDQEGERYLARLVRPLSEGLPGGADKASGAGRIRRIWTSRHDPRMAHPLLPPPPEGADQWPLEPLKPQAALDFFNELAIAYHIDYDPEIMSAYLRLWGGIPRWLANFARKAAETPERALLSGDLFLRAYMEDITDGPSSRDLYALLNPSAGDPLDPVLLARVAENRLDWPASQTNRRLFARGALSPAAIGAPSRPEEEPARQRLARAGLARYEGGRWQAPSTPLLSDALELYIAHTHGENLERSRVALMRRHLVETHRSHKQSERSHQLRDLAILMGTFKGQNVPRALLKAHAEETNPQDHLRIPYCIGAFVDRQASPGAPKAGVVIGWCFEEEEYYRSDETLWIAHSSSATVLTTEELDRIERENKRLARELDVGSVQAWLLTDGRFSPEAAQRAEKIGLHTSRWSDFQELGEILLRAPSSKHTFPQTKPQAPNDESNDEPLGAPSRSQAAGLFSAADRAAQEIRERLTEPPQDFSDSIKEAMENMAKEEKESQASKAPEQPQTAEAKTPINDQETIINLENEEFITQDLKFGTPGAQASHPMFGDHSAEPIPNPQTPPPHDENPPTPPPTQARIVEAGPDASASQVVDLSIPPRSNMELVAAKTIEGLAETFDYNREAIAQMKMAALEGCLNAIERSQNQEKEIRLRLVASPRKFTIIIENEGDTFDPQKVESPDIEKKLHQPNKRGWGLKLMEKFMDRVVFEPCEQGTRLRMEKLNRQPNPEKVAEL